MSTNTAITENDILAYGFKLEISLYINSGSYIKHISNELSMKLYVDYGRKLFTLRAFYPKENIISTIAKNYTLKNVKELDFIFRRSEFQFAFQSA